jgi:DNA-binding MarR family transcriptional regulator
MDDSALYTGLDEIPKGTFGNEVKDEQTQQLLDDERKKIKELTPKLQELIDSIDSEIKLVMGIDRFATATTQPESDIRAELQAAALYKQYLEQLKTKFRLALNETRK